MLVDTIAAMQGAVDAQSKQYVSAEITQAVIVAMRSVSRPGRYKRSVFDLAEFFVQLAQVDFGRDSYQVAQLMNCLGESLASGAIVAQSENQEELTYAD